MGPNEIVDVEALLVTHDLLARNFLFDKKQLSLCEIRSHKQDRGANLAYVSDLEHSLVVEGLLCLNNTGQINKFRRIQVVRDVEDSTTRVCSEMSTGLVDVYFRGRTFELEPNIRRDFTGSHHFAQLATVLSRGHAKYELLLEGQLFVVGVELAIIRAKEGHARSQGSGLFTQLELELWCGLCLCRRTDWPPRSRVSAVGIRRGALPSSA